MLSNTQSGSALVQTFTMLGMDHSEGLCMYSVEIIKLLVIDSPVLFLFRYIVNRFGLEIAIAWSCEGCWSRVCGDSWQDHAVPLLDVDNEAARLNSRLNQHCVIGENFDPAAAKSICFSLHHPCWLVEHNLWDGVPCTIWPSRYLSLSRWRIW